LLSSDVNTILTFFPDSLSPLGPFEPNLVYNGRLRSIHRKSTSEKRDLKRLAYLLTSRSAIKISLTNARFGEFVDRIFPIDFEIKGTTDTDISVSYLNLHLEIGNEGRLRTKLYEKRSDFNFHIVNFPFICSNISAAAAYGVYISQLIRYSRACGSYEDFLDRWLLLTKKLLNQGFLLVQLKA
jgi:hypothetical protein